MTARFTRAGTPSDAARIAAIYNQGMEDRVATFETETRSAEQTLKWFDEGYPVLVSGEGAEIYAYAVAFPYRRGPAMKASGNSRFMSPVTPGAKALARWP